MRCVLPRLRPPCGAALTCAVLTCVVLSGTAQANCRQALALGLDVSGSVDTAEYRLQLDGLAAALLSPEVSGVLLGDPDWPVRIAVYEWSGPRPADHRLIAGWTDITDIAALNGLVTRLQNATRRTSDPSTALGGAMLFGAALLGTQPDCPRRTLDISGDGISNTGPRPRDVALPNWLTINGLVVGEIRNGSEPNLQELSAYYTANVLHGPAAFIETAKGFDAYQDAMTRKLLRELQGLSLATLRP